MNEKRKERADRVGGIVHEVGTNIGLSTFDRALAEHKARQIAWSEDPLKAGLEELDEHPELEKKAGKWLQEKNASDVLNQLGRENPKLKAEADELLRKNPWLAKLLWL